MEIFITGASGFIGQYVVRRALMLGHQVRALKRPGVKEPYLMPGLRWIDASMTSIHTSSISGSDVLIHLAAHGVVGPGGWGDCFQVNVSESLAFWQKAHLSGVRRFVIAGSCFEYGRSGPRYDFIPTNAPLEPTGAYHSSKAAATMAAIGFAVEKYVELIVLRPFHVFGPGEAESRFWPSLRQAAFSGADFPMTGGAQIRDFIPVTRVATEFIAATSCECAPGFPIIQNLGRGEPVSLQAFAEHWWRAWGAKGNLRLGLQPYRPNEVMRYVPAVRIPIGSIPLDYGDLK